LKTLTSIRKSLIKCISSENGREWKDSHYEYGFNVNLKVIVLKHCPLISVGFY
jgi:hypothetical protein